MKIWAAISSAFIGWQMILKGEADWRDHFSISAPGLASALLIYAFLAFIAVAFASTSIGMPNVLGVLAAMFVLALPVVSLVLTLLITRNVLKSHDPMLVLLVPGVYALAVFLLVEGLLAMLGGPIVMLAWVGLGYLLYRLVRAATSWSFGVAAAFALFTVVLLVAMRLALYMLSSTVAPVV